MSTLYISHPTSRIIGKIAIPGSKSESNRLLFLKHLYFPHMEINRLSDSSDTQFMKKALVQLPDEIYVGDAGTAMRFMTAFCALAENRSFTLKGTERMHQRPIKILVEALQCLGADIEYLENAGYPPVRVKGKKIPGGEVEVDSSVSSQYISALMMAGPAMEKGIRILMNGMSVSAPYIYLTAHLMRKLGFSVEISSSSIEVLPAKSTNPPELDVEPDWSAASYWYSMVLLARQAEIYLPGFKQHSLQGDAFVSDLFAPLGVDSHFIGSGFRLKKAQVQQEKFTINLIHNPDLAQTMVVAFAALGVPAKISGLQTLKIKETDRLEALKTELEKTGAEVEIGEDYIHIHKGIQNLDNVVFDTYDDHRMAMSFAPLALLSPIAINEPEVVEKSYASFWADLEKVGFILKRKGAPKGTESITKPLN